MGLLDRFRRRGAPAAPQRPPARPPSAQRTPRHPSLRWAGETPPSTCIVGERHYGSNLAKAIGRRRERGYLQAVDVTLVRDPNNQHDANAIRAEIGGLQVGFVAKDVAADLAPALDAAGAAQCVVPGIVRDGTSEASPRGGKPHRIEVWLDRVSAPSRLRLSSGSANPASWPPRAFEGQLACTSCGGFAWIKEGAPGALECERCGETWRAK